MEVTAEMIAELRGSRYPEEILQKHHLQDELRAFGDLS